MESSIHNLPDEELILRSTAEPHVFAVLVDRYQHIFLNRALAILKNQDDAEDAVQEAFVRVYRFGNKFNSKAGVFRSWAMTILMNIIRTKLRKRVVEWLNTAPLTNEHYESLPAAETDQALIADAVQRLLESAPPEIAELLRLAYLEGMSYEEIASIQGVSVGTIKTRVHRAKKVLRGVIQRMEQRLV